MIGEPDLLPKQKLSVLDYLYHMGKEGLLCCIYLEGA
jgi:hypothetical protein